MEAKNTKATPKKEAPTATPAKTEKAAPKAVRLSAVDRLAQQLEEAKAKATAALEAKLAKALEARAKAEKAYDKADENLAQAVDLVTELELKLGRLPSDDMSPVLSDTATAELATVQV